jgi:hypothetical protein
VTYGTYYFHSCNGVKTECIVTRTRYDDVVLFFKAECQEPVEGKVVPVHAVKTYGGVEV